jgi:hypothetical protein
MDQDVLLVHGSNDPSTFRPELIPMDVVKWALVLIPSDVIVPSLFCDNTVNKGIMSFTYADILPLSQGLANHLPSKTASYLLLALPVSIPIMYRTDSTVRGPVKEGHVDCFENNLSGSSWWLHHIILWSAEVQAAVLADRAPLKGKKFIPTPKNPAYVDTIFMTSPLPQISKMNSPWPLPPSSLS